MFEAAGAILNSQYKLAIGLYGQLYVIPVTIEQIIMKTLIHLIDQYQINPHCLTAIMNSDHTIRIKLSLIPNRNGLPLNIQTDKPIYGYGSDRTRILTGFVFKKKTMRSIPVFIGFGNGYQIGDQVISINEKSTKSMVGQEYEINCYDTVTVEFNQEENVEEKENVEVTFFDKIINLFKKTKTWSLFGPREIPRDKSQNKTLMVETSSISQLSFTNPGYIHTKTNDISGYDYRENSRYE